MNQVQLFNHEIPSELSWVQLG